VALPEQVRGRGADQPFPFGLGSSSGCAVAAVTTADCSTAEQKPEPRLSRGLLKYTERAVATILPSLPAIEMV